MFNNSNFYLSHCFYGLKYQTDKNPLLAKQETEYIVSISDNVSFNDFKKKYKIIDKDDNIYIYY